MQKLILLLLVLGLCLPTVVTVAQDKDEKRKATGDQDKTQQSEQNEEALTLKRLFPEKSLFGPSARGMAFSHDGRYGAYLYRPYLERRHSSDLWIYDVQAQETRRVTSVSVMADFQKATREVRKDRIKKAKKRTGKKKKDEAENGDDAKKDDGVSGEWEGTLKGDEDSDLPPDGIAFTLSIEVSDDGAVSGTMVTPLSSGTITEGSFDAHSSKLTCTLTDPETGLAASLDAEINDGSMTGTLAIEGTELTLTLEAQRTKTRAELDEQEDDEQDEDAGRDEQKKDDDERDLGDIVDDKDADDEKAPRYGGVSSFVWAPHADELIFTSAGDLYQYGPETGEITRLTRTRDTESAVQYLPDGAGYTYLRSGGLVRVSFGTHLIEQLNPRLPSGERMSRYRISPDGTRLVFLATKGDSTFSRGRQINIVNYRQRFAQVRQVRRHMPDDPLPEFHYSVYLYELDDHMNETGQLKKIYSHKQTGPRDIMRVPEWSPDSTRVAFAVFSQDTGHIEILESAFVAKEEEDEDENDGTDDDDDEVGNGDDDDDDEGDDEDEQVEEDEEDEESSKFDIQDATTVYRFFHNGGPNTPGMIRPRYLPDSHRLAFITELSGFRHVHVLDPTYEQLDQLTRGRFEVYPIDISDDHQRLFAHATKGDPTQRHIFTIDLQSGDMTQLSKGEGYFSSAAVSNDGQHTLASFADFGTLRELIAINIDDDEPTTLTDSHPEKTHKLTEPIPEYFTYKNRHGHEIHGHMFKPDDWTPNDKRPLMIYVYGGPLGTRKMVSRGSFSSAGYFFAYYMAKKHGFVTCTIDPRGVSGYGGLFEKSNFDKAGKPQVEDLVDGVKWFIENQGVDAKRVSLHGWSFGGFQTQMCLYTEPDVFACGIAGAGPTEWANYNSWYTTGTIGQKENLDSKSTENELYSLLPLAKNLKAKLLLVHGMEDSNVLYQDTVRVYRELLKAGKETLVELFLDPTGGHGLGGDVKTLNRYRKYEEFLVRCLGEGEPAVAQESTDTEGENAGENE
ncbi:MAG: prolyl oligopeptidase family serine peptidase [Phycisphaerales bacterium]